MTTSTQPTPVRPPLPRLGQGFQWQGLSVGQRFETFRRTITETDLVNFTAVTGMLEAIVLDTTFAVASSVIHVVNQHRVMVMTYTAKRLLAGRPTV